MSRARRISGTGRPLYEAVTHHCGSTVARVPTSRPPEQRHRTTQGSRCSTSGGDARRAGASPHPVCLVAGPAQGLRLYSPIRRVHRLSRRAQAAATAPSEISSPHRTGVFRMSSSGLHVARFVLGLRSGVWLALETVGTRRLPARVGPGRVRRHCRRITAPVVGGEDPARLGASYIHRLGETDTVVDGVAVWPVKRQMRLGRRTTMSYRS